MFLKISSLIYVLPYYNSHTNKFYTTFYASWITVGFVLINVAVNLILTHEESNAHLGWGRIAPICRRFMRDIFMIFYLIYVCNVSVCNNFLQATKSINHILKKNFNKHIIIKRYGVIYRAFLCYTTLILHFTVVMYLWNSMRRQPTTWNQISFGLSLYYKTILTQTFLCGYEAVNDIQIYLTELNNIIDKLAKFDHVGIEVRENEEKLQSLLNLRNSCDDLVRYFNQYYKALVVLFLTHAGTQICLKLRRLVADKFVMPLVQRVHLIYQGYLVIVSNNYILYPKNNKF